MLPNRAIRGSPPIIIAALITTIPIFFILYNYTRSKKEKKERDELPFDNVVSSRWYKEGFVRPIRERELQRGLF
jgi:hypothetical protein